MHPTTNQAYTSVIILVSYSFDVLLLHSTSIYINTLPHAKRTPGPAGVTHLVFTPMPLDARLRHAPFLHSTEFRMAAKEICWPAGSLS